MTAVTAVAGEKNRPMWFVKFAMVALYHYGLSQLFGSWESLQEFKFYSFLIVTPIVKFFFLFEGCKTTRSKKEFLLSVVGDTLQCFLFWKVTAVYCRGNWYFLFPFLQAFAVTGLDVLCWLVLDRGSDDPAKNRFVVKLSKNPFDYMLIAAISFSKYCTSLAITDYDAPISGIHIVALAITILYADLSFGMFHYLSHTVPWLWKSHKVHHEYKRQDLNSLASFYSDLPDAFVMNSGLLLSSVVANVVGGPFAHPWLHIEYFLPALHSHSKYPTLYFNYIGFYELEVFALVTAEPRTSDFHNHHHNASNAYFSLYGSCPDWVIKRIVDPFIPKSSRVPE